MDRILVVDDEPRHRGGLVNMLRTLRPEYEILEAKNGREALDAAVDPAVKIVITDIKMPVLDGLEFLRAMQLTGRSIRVIILSGYAYFEYAQTALRLGAFDFVLKPVNKVKVDEMLKKAEKSLAEEAQARVEEQRIKNRLDALLPAYQDRQLDRWVSGDLNEAEVEELKGLLMLYGKGMVLAIDLSRCAKTAAGEGEPGTAGVERRVRSELAGAFGPQYRVVPFCQQGQPGRLLAIVAAPAMEEAALQEALQRFSAGLRASFGVNPTIGYGSICAIAALNAPECRRQAVAALEARKTAGQEGHDICIIKKCKAFIDTHYAEDLSLELLAARFSFNASYFSSFFKKNTGENFTDYLLKVRMKKAVELLKGSGMKVYEIAEKTGYANEKYFHRVFKKEFGVAPDEFRRNSASL